MLLRSSVLAVVLSILGSVAADVSRGAIVNGSFETANFTGWTVNIPGLATVTSGAGKLSESGTWTPTDGNYFAYLQTGGGEGVYTIISQVFAASAGEVLSFDAFFDAGDYLPFNDNGFVNLVDASTNLLVASLYSKDVAAVGDFGSDGWTNVSHIFAASGSYKIQAGVANIGDNGFDSALGLDNVELTGQVPEPATLILWSLGGLGLAVSRLRRRKSV